MKLKELTNLFRDAVTAGAQKALSGNSVLADRISKAEAYRIYGRSDVDRWISEGLISATESNGRSSKKCIDSKRLDAIAASSNRITYLPVADRQG